MSLFARTAVRTAFRANAPRMVAPARPMSTSMFGGSNMKYITFVIAGGQ
jgi:hypothetical protein